MVLTPKIHIILHHLCNNFNEINITLVTDELVEPMHKFVEKCMTLSRYIVKDITNISHNNKLLYTVTYVKSNNL